MLQQIFLGILGLCSGIVIAGGTVGLLIGLSIVPRYAGITHTGSYLLLYEDVVFAGAVFGNLWYLFSWKLPFGSLFLGMYGLFSGIFLGGWILALEEIADIFPVFTRRIRLTQGLPLVILALAVGKSLGSLLYYWKGVFL
jgi:stage V sporulation protein AB